MALSPDDPLKRSRAYLVRERKPGLLFRTVEEALRSGREALIVSRANPVILREDFELGKTRIHWLSEGVGGDCINPENPAALVGAVRSFLERREDPVVAMEGIEYLCSRIGSAAAARTLETLRDIVTGGGGTFLVGADRAALDEELASLFEREYDPLPFDGFGHPEIIDVFLIDARSGILVCHPPGKSKTGMDPDVLAGMLTVILDFVKKSFAEGTEELRRFELGDKAVIIERGARLIVAIVFLGREPANLRLEMRAFANRSEREYRELLEQWSGAVEEMSDLEAAAGRVFLESHETEF